MQTRDDDFGVPQARLPHLSTQEQERAQDHLALVWTQSREAVSRAQARIREAVTRNRQDKLTVLLHHINIEVLRAGFFGLKKTLPLVSMRGRGANTRSTLRQIS
jgi:hypothetical protein